MTRSAVVVKALSCFPSFSVAALSCLQQHGLLDAAYALCAGIVEAGGIQADP